MLSQAFAKARAASVPIVAVKTPDPAQTISSIMALYKGDNQPAAFQWDVARGLRALNKLALDALNRMKSDPDQPMEMFYAETMNPVSTLTKAIQTPGWDQRSGSRGSIVFMQFLHQYLENPAVVQAIWNLRDEFKNRRTLVMLAPDWNLPPELSQDVLLLDEPLPDESELRRIVTEQLSAAGGGEAEESVVTKAVHAVTGLSAFCVEQTTCLSVSIDKGTKAVNLDIESLWKRKCEMIESTPGLSVWRGGNRFDDVGGCDNVKEFMSRLISGQNRPRVVAFLDEIEKMMAGSTGIGDSSGVSQAMLGKLLSVMQDRNYLGVIFIGVAGSGKTEIAKCTGAEAGVPTVAVNLGDMKGSLVGSSEARLNQALKVIDAVGNGQALFIATCNQIAALPPELRRRFALGTFFFDLPTREERDFIWRIYERKFGVVGQPHPDDHNWTGAEIRTACMMAGMYGIPLDETGNYIVPVATSMGDGLVKLRQMAHDRFISSSYPGKYKDPAAAATVSEWEAQTRTLGGAI